MVRAIVAPAQVGTEIAPGVRRRRVQPGGRRGPANEVLGDLMGGQVWSEMFMFGGPDDGLPMVVPDIRLPANQYWPPHWHSCWIAVIILDGRCRIGDWEMHEGDVLISDADVEYGPLVIGPDGCQMFEIFARLGANDGGYAAEFADHPTLEGTIRPSGTRNARNMRNAGRQVLPVASNDGLVKGHLRLGGEWNLGAADDPERSIIRSTVLGPGDHIAAHSYTDWHGIFILGGAITLAGTEFVRNDVLTMEPATKLGPVIAGKDGALLLEVSRVAAGMVRHPLAELANAELQ